MPDDETTAQALYAIHWPNGTWSRAYSTTRDKYRRYANTLRPFVEAVHRAGREAAAADIRSADTSGWPAGRQSEVDGCREAAAKIAEGIDNHAN